MSARARIWLWFIGILAVGSFSIPANAQTFSTPGSWSYTVPAGVTKVQVQVSGGGGAEALLTVQREAVGAMARQQTAPAWVIAEVVQVAAGLQPARAAQALVISLLQLLAAVVAAATTIPRTLRP